MFINRYLISFASESIKKILSACLLDFLVTLLSTLTSLFIAIAVNMIIGTENVLFFKEIHHAFLAAAAMIIMRFFIFKIKMVEAAKCGIEIKENLRCRLLQKLFMLGPAYTSKKRTGDIASIISSKTEWLNNYYTIYLPTVVSAVINAVLIITVIMMFDIFTAVVCIIACIGILGAPMIFYKIMKERGNAEWEAHSKYYSDCLDSIQGISSLKAFNANNRQREKIHRQGEILRKSVMEQLKITMLEGSTLEFFARLGSIVSIIVAVISCENSAMRPELLVYILFLASACFMPMLTLISAWHMGYKGITGSYGIAELLNEPVSFSLSSSSIFNKKELIGYFDEKARSNKAPSCFEGDIIFSDVCFSYCKNEADTLKNVSFKIPNKTMTALVGPSGSGKSTIAHLLAGFYLSQCGTIKIGEKILSRDSVSHIQDLISAVWQNSHIFYGTAYENILIGNPKASYDEVVSAAKNANIHDFIMTLPEGYNTLLGERGMRFSDGECQRIAIARAFLRNSPIIIFDEATSSLDRKNEIDIQKSFQRLSSEKTVLVIAHRLATIQNAQQICIVEDGQIKAFGKHEELTKASELYRKLMGGQLTGGAT